LWCCTASGSSASRSLWTTSACMARPDTMRSRILLRLFDGRTTQYLMKISSVPVHSIDQDMLT
jgi:hypothetical protein